MYNKIALLKTPHPQPLSINGEGRKKTSHSALLLKGEGRKQTSPPAPLLKREGSETRSYPLSIYGEGLGVRCFII